MIFRLMILLSLFSIHLCAKEVSNVLLPGDNVQVNYEVSMSTILTAGTPIPVSVMVTHKKSNPVDTDSFHYGNKSLPVTLAQVFEMPSNEDLIVSVYQAQLEGLQAGKQVLESIGVKVGGKVYQSPPVTLSIYPKDN